MTLPYYPFYWGDYSAKTFNLTQGQHGAYMLLMRHIYTEGTQIPDKQCYSIAKAMLPEEMENVDYVLSKFFTLEGGFWVNHRSIEVMNEWQEKHQRRVIAGKKAKKQCLSNGEAMPKQPEPEPEPVIRKEEPKKVLLSEKRGTRLPDDFEPDATCAAVAEEMLLTNRQSQIEFEKFKDYWKGKSGASGVKLDWQATFRNWLRNAKVNSNANPSKPAYVHPADIAADKLRTQLGIKKGGGETRHDSHGWIEGDYSRE